ncbi:class I SAM-dependent methyltransferase [Polaribacter sp. IC073]|uniref:class I SAM-dependent methyltransferase n=1 Tax=Polaribacter sp. IC073 TaxID=2508540 RepID=UPI0011BD9B99|nr:class I SAM-dependent methyltransferase [Polaribacter sp. IC073]TXD48450.1 class I SAM-dependent methyltransferase [Polaribacter sp. IC073]
MNQEVNRIKKTKKPWPTKDAMQQVYEMKLWGGNNSNFYSGDGSHNSEIVNPYVAAITRFLVSFKTPITVCDLGCGDFNVGKNLVKHTKKYLAVDIVKDLIAYNKKEFKAERLEFLCLDIAEDELPAADCALVRQVLQHLSNAEVLKVMHKLKDFKYVILTEHLPLGEFVPNKDIISGQGIRFKKQSGINLLMPPFNLTVKEETVLVSFILKDSKGVIITTLYQLF